MHFEGCRLMQKLLHFVGNILCVLRNVPERCPPGVLPPSCSGPHNSPLGLKALATLAWAPALGPSCSFVQLRRAAGSTWARTPATSGDPCHT